MTSAQTPSRSRDGRPPGAQRLFDEVLLSPLPWPGKTLRLEPDSVQDYRGRPVSAQISVAELYHENSKLSPHHLPVLAASRNEPDAMREEFLRRRAVVARASGGSPATVDGGLRALAGAVARSCDARLFYAVELYVLSGRELSLHEPIGNLLQVVKRLTAGEVSAVHAAVSVLAEPVEARIGLVLLVGSLARNDLLFGPRGYRRTLIEAGRVAEAVVAGAGRLGLGCRPTCEFLDRPVDDALELDGVEQSCLVAIGVGGGAVVG